MPATAGRVRMPANNRVHSSAALTTHPIWKNAIRYDPYAPTKTSEPKPANNTLPESENPYVVSQGLLALARVTNLTSHEVPGACKKCGRVGHLTFQCRNFLSAKEGKIKDQEPEAAVLSGGLKIGVKDKSEAGSSEEESSDSSDSEYDSEIERIIARKFGKSVTSSKLKASSNKNDDDSDSGDKKRRGRSKKRRTSRKKKDLTDSDSDDERKKKKDKRRRRKD